ncbi:peroxiredoxin family protein [Lentiprolixibacter aurantiacus]|uniref:TlpA disulfide reductase family protein n=1 Tax=Lentiprolixibacter aurantiacus TaxID=2993939 RepID=A0AAE3MLK9_9FLAO|nr:TlpA disulfide reductase family protein [Lentiprolixibacter aurantiacus]MCX2719423.1 TlpA disulfide reductase family protein [Lentiprolixibacter aurantiacus]
MRIKLVILGIITLLLGCKEQPTNNSLKTGPWRGILMVKDQKKLPFTFNLDIRADKYSMQIRNAEELIEVDEITTKGDSITIKFPVFEGYIAGTFDSTRIRGVFIKESLDRIVPFRAEFGKNERFPGTGKATSDISGVWETVFYPMEKDPYKAKGIFTQTGNLVTGTFRTATGDYRYLEGVVEGDSLMISTFDGAHAFLFTAGIKDSTLSGKFYSGNHSLETFEAKRNEGFELPDADSLTFIKEGYERFEFAFPHSEGSLITSDDARFTDKVLIIQIMGTWCPNCLDESKFLVEYLEKNPNEDLEVVALAFEYAKTEELAFKAINRLRERLGISYPILLAQYGSSDKGKANEKLPMLNRVLSYPTTIFIDKKGEVRKISTGFNGPATGQKYLDFKEDFHALVSTLLSE